MSLDRSVEKTIRDAIDRGEFDDLRGKGKPLDLKPYFDLPEDLRMAYSLLRSSDAVPAEVDLMREIASLRSSIGAAADETEKAQLSHRLNERMLVLRLEIEKRAKKR
jgi:hypothetical protein